MNTIKIKMNRGCVGADFVYAAGGEYDAPEDRARDLIQAGHATPVSAKASSRAENAISPASKKAEKR